MQDGAAKRMEWMKCFPALALALVLVQTALAAEPLDRTIAYLLDYIGKSDAVFIRNGATHTPAEAVEHVQDKYEHFKAQIRTPEDFIRLAATKSLLTDKPYLVVPRGGREEPLSEWLTRALEAHRAAEHR
jgi:Family of unknown function (DUF5329)